MKTSRIIRLIGLAATLAVLAGFTGSAAGEPMPGTWERVGMLFNASNPSSPQHHPTDSIPLDFNERDRVRATVVDQGYEEGLYATRRRFLLTFPGDPSVTASDSISSGYLHGTYGDGGGWGITVRVKDKDVSAKYRLIWRLLSEPRVRLKPGTGDAVLNRAHRLALTEYPVVTAYDPQTDENVYGHIGYQSLRIQYLKDGKLRGSVIATSTPGDAGNFDFPADVVFTEKGTWTIRTSIPESGTCYAQTIEMPIYVNRPTLTINSDHVRATSTTSSRLWGDLTSRAGNRLTGRPIYLQKNPSGPTGWHTIRKLTTSTTGTVSAYVRPSVDSRYRFYYPGNSTHMERYSTVRWVSTLPRVYFRSAPHSTSPMAYGKSYKVWGDVGHKHPTGSKQFQLLAYKRTKRSDGTYRYVYKAAYTTRVSNPSAIGNDSRYTGYMKLPSKGRWRIRIRHPEDSEHAKSYSGYRYVTVN